MQITKSAISEKATISVRRMVGGRSVLLSGGGVPPASLASARSLGRTRNRLSPRQWRMDDGPRHRSGRLGDKPEKAPRVPRQDVNFAALDKSWGAFAGTLEPGCRDRVCCVKHQRDAHRIGGRSWHGYLPAHHLKAVANRRRN